MQPITIFEDKQEALECLRYYQHILSLDDWIIDIVLDYRSPCIAPAWGKSSIYRAIHTAIIKLPIPKSGQINNFAQRYCQELIVVHELMHCRLPSVDVEVESTEGEYYEAEQHATLELISKGIIMAKYGLDFGYFENF